MYCRFAPFIKRGGFGCHYPFYPATFVYLSQAGTWIYNAICYGFFLSSIENWLFSLLILVELLTIKIRLLFINNAKCRIIFIRASINFTVD
jgi:hypothetical protein